MTPLAIFSVVVAFLFGFLAARIFPAPIRWKKAKVVTPGENDRHAWLKTRIGATPVSLRFTERAIEEAMRAASANE